MIDPFGLMSDFSPYIPPSGVGARAGSRTVQFKPFETPEEEDSVLHKVLGTALGGLGYLGETVDKGGRAMRGLLAGRPGQLSNLIPFSDTLGITDPKTQTTGEDLARQWGLPTGTQDGTFEWADLVGPAIEIGTDPLTFMQPLGAANKFGRMMQKVGAAPKGFGGGALARTTVQEAMDAAEKGLNPLAKTALQENIARAAKSEGVDLANALGEKLGGHVGVGLPFMNPAATFDLSPVLNPLGSVTRAGFNMLPESIQTVGKGIGKGAAAVGRVGRGLFDQDVRGHYGELAQAVAEKQSQAEKVLAANAKANLFDMERRWNSAGLDDVRHAIEQRSTVGPWAGGFGEHPLADEMRMFLDSELMQPELRAGLATKDAGSGYFPRSTTHWPGLADLEKEKTARGAASGLTGTGQPGQIGREFPHINAQQANEFSTNPFLVGNDVERAKVFGPLPPHLVNDKGELDRLGYVLEKLGGIRSSPRGINPSDELKGILKGTQGQELIDEAKNFTEYLGQLSPDRAAKNLPLFGNNSWFDLHNRVRQSIKARTNADQVLDTIRGAAVPMGEGTVPVTDLLAKTHPKAPEVAAQLLGDVANMHVPLSVRNDLLRAAQGFRVPTALEPIVNGLDKFTNFWKSMVGPSMYPAGQFRNVTSGLLKNLSSGAGLGSGYQEARAAISGKPIVGLAKEFPFLGADDVAATKKFLDLSQVHAGAGGAIQSTEGLAPVSTLSPLSGVPGETPFPGLMRTLWDAIPKFGQDVPFREQANPFKVRGGFFGGEADKFAPLKAGRAIDSSNDATARIGGMLSLIRQGYAPEVAGDIIKNAHVPWEKLTDFESGVMRRAMPFYSYSRHSLPFELKALAQRPGELQGQLAREAYRERRDNQGFLPSYLGSGLAIPLGKSETGADQFLRGFGTPIEGATDMLQGGPNWVKDSLMSLGGNLNPLLKIPAEYMTGKQFYDQRDIGNLHSPTHALTGEKLGFADQLYEGLPTSRIDRLIRNVTDPKQDALSKFFNVGTGLKITAADMEKARLLTARQLEDAMLKGQPGINWFETPYVLQPDERQQDLLNLSPEQIMLLRLRPQIGNELKALAAQRRRNGNHAIG